MTTASTATKGSPASIAALIINWNGARDSLELLSSLCACQSSDVSITAIVIDNASTPQDLDTLSNGISAIRGMDVILRSNNVNVGVPAAYNQAIQVAGLGYDYYLRLDNDVIVYAAGLRAMVDALQLRASEGVEIAGGNTKYFASPSEDNGGAVTIDLVAGKTSVAYPDADVICDGVLGCIMLLSGGLVRRYAPEVFESALFLCTDESELSMRAAARGQRTIYVACTIGLHKSGASTRKVRILSDYYSLRNWTLHRLRYASSWRNTTLILLDIPIALARSLARGQLVALPALVAGSALAIVWLLDTRVRRGRC